MAKVGMTAKTTSYWQWFMFTRGVHSQSGKSILSCFNNIYLFWVAFSYSDIQHCALLLPCVPARLNTVFVDFVNRCKGADEQPSTVGTDLETHLACCQVGKLHPIPAVTEHQQGQTTTGQAHGDHMQTDMTRTLTSIPDKSPMSEQGACL